MFRTILQLPYIQRRPGIVQFVKFAIVGVLGTIVDFGVYSILTRFFDFYYISATAISVCAAIINNFYWNKYWTFAKGNSGKTGSESGKFIVVSLLNYALNIGITYAIVEHTSAEQWFGTAEDFFAKVVAIAIVLFSNYFANKYWTFRAS
ncbi:MAG: GtrA family protein [Candidatus Kerfeldbacteria bacterium]|nr:GtrA family protein [Candidatus Kerfeldbacteria bacterium]